MSEGITRRGLPKVAEILPVRFRAVSSTLIAFDDRKAIDQVVAGHPDLAGIVILHGTAAMEKPRTCCT
jgi:L-asparaginase